jgi:MoaA/NifB/PqqE/SkfB family radical SAM enzyme
METGLSPELFRTAETHNPNRMMPTEKAMEIIDDCAAMGVKAMHFTGGGEPTVHPNHLGLMRRAQVNNIETALVTNGVKLKPEDPTILSLKWIRVSIDAGDAKTYAQIRRVPDWHWTRVWENVEELATQYQGVLGVGYVVTPKNYKGIVAAAYKAREVGAQNIPLSGVTSKRLLDFYPGYVLPLIAHEVEKAKSASDSEFEVIDLYSRRMEEFRSGPPEIAACHYQHFTVYIGADLNVYRCCNVAYTTRGNVGSLKEQSFKDFMLQDAAANYYPFDGRECALCQFKEQNRAIDSMIVPPNHVNFT